MALLAAWFSSSGEPKIGAQLTDDISGLGDVGSGGRGRREAGVPSLNLPNRSTKQDISLAQWPLVQRDQLLTAPGGGCFQDRPVPVWDVLSNRWRKALPVGHLKLGRWQRQRMRCWSGLYKRTTQDPESSCHPAPESQTPQAGIAANT